MPTVPEHLFDTFPIDSSATPLTASLTDDGVKLAAATRTWEDDDNTREKQVSTASPYDGGAAPNRIEVSETPLSASTTNERVQVALDNGNWGNEATIGGK